MSGWHPSDRPKGSVNGSYVFRASNNITQPGTSLNDKNHTGTRSRTITQAHFKSLRCYRHWCRMMPWIIMIYSMAEHTNQ